MKIVSTSFTADLLFVDSQLTTLKKSGFTLKIKV